MTNPVALRASHVALGPLRSSLPAASADPTNRVQGATVHAAATRERANECVGDEDSSASDDRAPMFLEVVPKRRK
jgi:hypothetical protein